MKRLFAFELRKILSRRLVRIACAAVLGLSVILAVTSYRSMHAYDGQSREGSGKTAVEIDKELAKHYAGPLTDEKVHKMISALVPATGPNGLNARYVYWNAVQSSVAARFVDIQGKWNGASVADVYGDAEINVGYVNGWLHTSQNMARVNLFLAFIIVLMIAPVYAGEYGGVDAIIFTSRYGKTKCAAAKAAAAVVAALIVTVIVQAVNIAAAAAIYGTDGLEGSILFAPVTFSEGYIPFNITCGTLLTYQIVLSLTSAVSVTGLTLIVSAVCKNTLVSLVASAALEIAPMVFPISKISPLFRVIVLFPVYHAHFLSIMSVAQFENGMLYAVWAVPVSVAIALAGAFISRRCFAKHQIGM